MSRRTPRKTHAIDFEFAVNAAINRYYEKNPAPSIERQRDIHAIKMLLSHATHVPAQKHALIERYVRNLRTGLLGRSDLRDFVLQALASVPIEVLIKELLHHHQVLKASAFLKWPLQQKSYHFRVRFLRVFNNNI